MIARLKSGIKDLKAHPLRGSAYLDVAGCFLNAYAGLVGGGGTFSPAIFNDQAAVNWPMAMRGFYYAAIGSILMTTGRSRERLERRIERILDGLPEKTRQGIHADLLAYGVRERALLNAKTARPGLTGAFTRATEPLQEAWLEFRQAHRRAILEVSRMAKIDRVKAARLSLLRLAHMIVEKPIEANAILGLPMVGILATTPFFAGGTKWAFVQVGIASSSTALRLWVREPVDRPPLKTFFRQNAENRNPLKTFSEFVRTYPLTADGILFQVPMQVFNVVAAFDGAPVTLAAAGTLIMGAKIWRMVGSKNQNIAVAPDNPSPKALTI